MRPKPAHDITPIPPSLAIADAKPDKDTPTPIPPWTTGSFTSIFPIKNDFILFTKMCHDQPHYRLS